MAANPKLTTLAVNAEADALAILFDSGFLKIYSGSQPASADTAISGQTLLATLTFSTTAFPSAVAGVLTAGAIASDMNAAATGTATWFRAIKSDGITKIMDGSVGSANADLVLNTVAIQANAQVDCTGFILTLPKS
jgi:hypothetical protein